MWRETVDGRANSVATERAVLPPLASWVYTAAIVTVVIVALVAVIVMAVPKDSDLKGTEASAFARYNIERLTAVAEQDPERLVVMLGDSMLKYATRDGHYLIEPPGDGGGEPISVLRIVGNRAVFGDFGGIEKRVLDVGPDLIVLQSTLLTQDKSDWFDFRLLQELVRSRIFPSASEVDAFDFDQHAVQFDMPCINDFSSVSLGRRLQRNERLVVRDPDADGPRAARAFVAEARRRGIEVAAVELPPHPRMAAETATSTIGAPPAHGLPDGTRAWRVGTEIELNGDDYCDFVHMDESGREAFSLWLDGRVRETIDDLGEAEGSAHGS